MRLMADREAFQDMLSIAENGLDTWPIVTLIVSNNQLQIEEVNQLLQAVEERIESLSVDLQKLDATKDDADSHAIDEHIRALRDQQRVLSKRWTELTAGYSNNP